MLDYAVHKNNLFENWNSDNVEVFLPSVKARHLSSIQFQVTSDQTILPLVCPLRPYLPPTSGILSDLWLAPLYVCHMSRVWSVVMYWADADFFPFAAALFLILAAAGEVGNGVGGALVVGFWTSRMFSRLTWCCGSPPSPRWASTDVHRLLLYNIVGSSDGKSNPIAPNISRVDNRVVVGVPAGSPVVIYLTQLLFLWCILVVLYAI